MTDIALSIPAPSQPAPVKQTRTHLPKVTGKVRIALEALVWEGLPRKAAAEKAGISEHGLYKALRKPAVKAHYLSELQVLRTSERARNIHRLTEIRDKADNMPAVQAIKMLEELGDETTARSMGSLSLPGLTIQIINGPATAEPAVKVIDHE